MFLFFGIVNFIWPSSVLSGAMLVAAFSFALSAWRFRFD